MIDPNTHALIDLSVPLGPSVSEAVPVSVEYMPHQCGGQHLAELVGMPHEALHGGLGWASERISAITHSSTHIDAPHHYAPRCNSGRSRTIDEIPLEWFCGNGVCVNVPGAPDKLITVEEVEAFEGRSGYSVSARDIVLFRTGAETHYGSDCYNEKGRGLSRDLVEWLVERGVRVFGTDAWSIDPSFPVMTQRLQEDGAETVWAAHFVGRKYEFCAIEKLCNLHRLPAHGFWITCFPIKVKNGSAGWVRAVAFVPSAQDMEG